MVIGVVASMLAGMLWGLTFVAPLVAAPYSPFDLTIGRYLVFGFASLVLLGPRGWRLLRRLSRRDWILLGLLGFTGNVGYYLAMSLAVPRAGTAVVALIVGCLPVVMALLGNRGVGRVRLSQLLPSLTLIAAGLLAVNGAALAQAQAIDAVAPFLLGVILTFVAVALWAWYGLRNARALAEFPALSSTDWTILTGVGTFLTLLPLAIIGWVADWSAVPDLVGLPPSASSSGVLFSA